jgi:hypothetical protein
MTKPSELQRHEYPASYFPQVKRAVIGTGGGASGNEFDEAADQELRRKLIEDYQDLPTGVIAEALAEARKQVKASNHGLAAPVVRRGA